VSDPTPDLAAAPLDRFGPRGDLKTRAVRGGAVTLGSQGAKLVIQLGSTALLARLLTPEDYGAVAMVTALLGFTTLFRDLGLSIATVQRERITHEEATGLFWINVLAGVALMLIMLASAPLVAWFYGRPDLLWLTCVYAGITPITSLGGQHQALLQRSMRYGSLAARDIISLIAGVAVGITAGYLRLGYWALAMMQATTSVVSVITLWWQSGWRPGPPRWVAGLASLLRFGGTVTLSNVLGFLVQGLDSVLIGYFFGAAGVGNYNRAQNLLLRPMEQFMPSAMNVATSAFSRLASEPVRFERSALRLLSMVACVAGWVVALVMGTAPWVVALLLGAQWGSVVPILRVLALFAFVSPCASILGTFLVVRGQPMRLVRWRLLSTPITIVALVVGLPWGPIGVGTMGALVGLLVRTPLFAWYAARGLGISFGGLIRSSLHYVFSGLLAALALIQMSSVWSPERALVAFVAYSALGTLLYAALVLCRREGRALVRDMRALVGLLVQRRHGEPGLATPSAG
jgi:O-antigen/teichoic acid export membrane protein